MKIIPPCRTRREWATLRAQTSADEREIMGGKRKEFDSMLQK